MHDRSSGAAWCRCPGARAQAPTLMWLCKCQTSSQQSDQSERLRVLSHPQHGSGSGSRWEAQQLQRCAGLLSQTLLLDAFITSMCRLQLKGVCTLLLQARCSVWLQVKLRNNCISDVKLVQGLKCIGDSAAC